MFQSDKILKSKLSEIEPEQAEFQTKKKTTPKFFFGVVFFFVLFQKEFRLSLFL